MGECHPVAMWLCLLQTAHYLCCQPLDWAKYLYRALLGKHFSPNLSNSLFQKLHTVLPPQKNLLWKEKNVSKICKKMLCLFKIFDKILSLLFKCFCFRSNWVENKLLLTFHFTNLILMRKKFTLQFTERETKFKLCLLYFFFVLMKGEKLYNDFA